MKPYDIIDLEHYPIMDLDSESYKALVQKCKEQFSDAVSCHLPGFIKPTAISAILSEIEKKFHLANLYSVYRGAYNREDPRSLAHMVSLMPDDPRAKPQRRHQLWLGTDDLSHKNLLKEIYNWNNLTRFVGDVLGEPSFYTIDDPLMKILVNIHRDGDELGWHVDSHDYAVTILLQPAYQGGLYQYVPLTGPGGENFDYAAKLLAGDDSRVCNVPMQAGSMVIFRGRDTLHRVTPVKGNQIRVLALFSYEIVPGRTYGASFRRNLLNREHPRSVKVAAKALDQTSTETIFPSAF